MAANSGADASRKCNNQPHEPFHTHILGVHVSAFLDGLGDCGSHGVSSHHPRGSFSRAARTQVDCFYLHLGGADASVVCATSSDIDEQVKVALGLDFVVRMANDDMLRPPRPNATVTEPMPIRKEKQAKERECGSAPWLSRIGGDTATQLARMKTGNKLQLTATFVWAQQVRVLLLLLRISSAAIV